VAVAARRGRARGGRRTADPPDGAIAMMLDAWLQAQVAKLPQPLGGKLERELAKRWVALALALLALLSTIPIASVIGWGTTLLAALGLAALVALAIVGWSEYCTALVVVLGAIVLPWLALISFNFALGWLLRPLGLGLRASLVVAGIVFAAAAFGYLTVWKERRVAALVVALVLAPANVVGLPLLIASGKHESAVVASQPYVSKLDLAIVVPGGATAPVASAASAGPSRGWDVRWSVARAGDATSAWLLLDSSDPDAALAAASGAGAPLPGAPAWRADADRVVLLDVDGTPPAFEDPAALPSLPGRDGEVARWLRIAGQLAPGAQVAALLQTTDRARLDAWRRRLDPLGGSVASVQRLGSRSLADAAQLLAVQAPGASEELALATRYRPILLFDRGERRPSPFDVDDFFASGRVSLCHDDQIGGGDNCEAVLSASALTSGPTHLRIRPARRGDPVVASAIYVHPTTRTEGARTLLFLDYWWYLDDNPARVGHGATCGVGLSMPGITCFDHPSDWEGMTIVLDMDGDVATPIAVQYAQHKEVVRYAWAELQARWARWRTDPRSFLSRQVRRHLDMLDDAADRPVAFVGAGTHATYARPCTGPCHQTLDRTTENRYGGESAWTFDDTASCVEVACVRPLPTRHGGRDAALWNAYAGVWGDRHCILKGAYCTAELSPSAPSTQVRYRDPERITGWVDADEHAHRCGGDGVACPALPPAQAR